MTDMRPAISLVRAMRDPALLGGPFASPSFWPWFTFAKLIDGEVLTEAREIELFQQCTGRTRLPTGPVRRGVILAGRRAGKDRFMSAVAVWRSALCADWRMHVSAGEGLFAFCSVPIKQAGRILRRYCEGLLQAPLLAAEIMRRTDDVIEFRNGASLEISTNDASLVAGVPPSRCWAVRLALEDRRVRGFERRGGGRRRDAVVGHVSRRRVAVAGHPVHRKRGYMYENTSSCTATTTLRTSAGSRRRR